MVVTENNWADIHSQTWPMTPYETEYGYTPVVGDRPLLARSFGAPVMGGGKRRRRRRQRRQERRVRAAYARGGLTRLRTGMSGFFDGIFGGGKGDKVTQSAPKAGAPKAGAASAPGGKESGSSVPPASSSSGGGLPGRGGAIPVGAESVPPGRDPATYFRSLGFTQGQARDLARERNVQTRRQMMDRFSFRNRPRGGGGGGFAAFSSALGSLFGQGREAAQGFDFGGGGGVPAAEPPPSTGMSTGMIAALAAAGLGAVYLATQAGS